MGKFESKLRQPQFHSKNKDFTLIAPIKAPETKEQEKKFLDNMNGLDLELS